MEKVELPLFTMPDVPVMVREPPPLLRVVAVPLVVWVTELAETPPAAIATALVPAVWKYASLPVVHATGVAVPGLEDVAQNKLVPHVPLPAVKPFVAETSQ
jgi:predicted membrane metal-binding protein